MVARFRPQNKIEIASGGEPIVEFKNDDTCTIQVRHASSIDTCPNQPTRVADTMCSRKRPLVPLLSIVSST